MTKRPTVTLPLALTLLFSTTALTLTGCGRHDVSQSQTLSATAAATPDVKLFYPFPIADHAKNFVKNVAGPSDDPQAGWSYSVGPNTDESNHFGSDRAIITNWDRNNYNYGQTSLNLQTGELYYHYIHSGTFAFKAPTAGGDYTEYMEKLDGMAKFLKQANAAADVLAYVASVQNYLSTQAKSK